MENILLVFRKNSTTKMETCWQNEGVRSLGLNVSGILMLPCSFTGLFFNCWSVIEQRSLKNFQNTPHQYFTEGISCSYIFMILSALLKHAILFFFISAFENRSYVFKFICENNFITFFFSHKSAGLSGLLCFELNFRILVLS